MLTNCCITCNILRNVGGWRQNLQVLQSLTIVVCFVLFPFRSSFLLAEFQAYLSSLAFSVAHRLWSCTCNLTFTGKMKPKLEWFVLSDLRFVSFDFSLFLFAAEYLDWSYTLWMMLPHIMWKQILPIQFNANVLYANQLPIYDRQKLYRAFASRGAPERDVMPNRPIVLVGVQARR